MSEKDNGENDLEDDDEIIEIQSVVKEPSDIKWPTDTGFEIIDTAIVTEDMQLLINFRGKEYHVRSADRRLTQKFMKYKHLRKAKKIKLSEGENLSKHQEEIIRDMIPDLNFDDMSIRIDEIDWMNFARLSWAFRDFLQKKLRPTKAELTL